MEHADDNDDDADDEASSGDNFDGISDSYEYNLDEDKFFGDQSSYMRKLQSDGGRREDVRHFPYVWRHAPGYYCFPQIYSHSFYFFSFFCHSV